MLVKYTTLWLFTLSQSPCNLYVYYLLLISGLFTLALAGDIFFFYRVHNVVLNACMYACTPSRRPHRYNNTGTLN